MGAGHAKEDDILSTVAGQIEDNQQSNIQHEGVKVPRHITPWTTEAAHAAFCKALAEVKQSGFVPENFGMLPEEWDEDGYPAFKTVTFGRRGGKILHIALPDHVWRLRAVVWCQALEVVTCIQDMIDT
jgi:hypothetical protein